VRQRTWRILIVEDVKQAAVQHGVEVLAEVGQSRRIRNQEPHRQTAVASLAARNVDRRRNGIDTRSVEPACGRHECVFTGATSHVKHAPCEGTLLG